MRSTCWREGALKIDAPFTTVYVLAHGRPGDAVLEKIKLLNTIITSSSQPGVENVLIEYGITSLPVLGFSEPP